MFQLCLLKNIEEEEERRVLLYLKGKYVRCDQYTYLLVTFPLLKNYRELFLFFLYHNTTIGNW